MAGLRIALVSTPFVSVPPCGYGGTELVIAELAQALTARGVEVVVYATGDSNLPGIEVRSYFPTPQWPPDNDVERVHAAWCLRDIARDPRGFDLVHLNSAVAVEMSRLCETPMVCTVHHDYEQRSSAIYRAAPQVLLVAISHNQALRETAEISAVVHHGLSPERFVSLPDQGYLLFLGRYARVKGAHTAVEAAAAAGLPLVMAGEIHEARYFHEQVAPLIREHGVIEVGQVGGARKQALIARARALIFPIEWEEPFGLVMIEAMLSGVPVLATARGSVSEVIEDGVTGSICTSTRELSISARLAERRFNRQRVQTHARRRWSAARMAAEYLQVYRLAIIRPQLEELDGAAGA